MRRVYAVANGKGGVAKTTTVANLAVADAQAGLRVLVVDMDPRFSLTRWFTGPEHLETLVQRNVVTLMEGAEGVDVDAAALVSRVEGVRIVGSPGEGLEEAEQRMANADYREEILAEALRDELDDFDVVYIDCPANLGLLTMNALHACERVLIPVAMDDEGGFNGVTGVVDKVEKVAKRRRGLPVVDAIVRTRLHAGLAVGEEIDSALPAFGLPITQTSIRDSDHFRSAGVARSPLLAHRPWAKAGDDYRELAAELRGAPVTAAKAVA